MPKWKDNKFELVHVQQNHNSGCALACVAMLANVPYNDVFLKFTEIDDIKKGVTYRQECWLYRQFGVKVCCRKFAYFNYGHIYSVTVPSINHPKQTHRIVVDTRYAPFDEWRILDPQEGRFRGGSKKYFEAYGPKWDLKGWTEVTQLISRGCY